MQEFIKRPFPPGKLLRGKEEIEPAGTREGGGAGNDGKAVKAPLQLSHHPLRICISFCTFEFGLVFFVIIVKTVTIKIYVIETPFQSKTWSFSTSGRHETILEEDSN